VFGHCILLYAKHSGLSKCGKYSHFKAGSGCCARVDEFWYNVDVDSFAGAPASGGQEDL
jgi:hypothetical protein